MKYYIGTDIGTSGTKSILMSQSGELIASAYEEYGLMTEKPLWAEQWPQPWNDAVFHTIKGVVTKSGIAAGDIIGICVSGLYGGSGIPLDEHMKPVRPCLIWMDRRAHEVSQLVEKTIGAQRLYEVTANGMDPYYGFCKILWIKENEPENWQKTKLFLPPNSYAIYQMTHEIAIDYSSAGNLGGIFDMAKRCWSQEMMQAMGIPSHMMPQRIVASSDVVGGLTQEAAAQLGLLPGTPVCAGGVDCTVAALGLGLQKAGQHVAIIGTSMTWGFVHGGENKAKELITMPFVKDDKELLFTFGGAATAGGLARWFRNVFAKQEYEAELHGGKNAYAVLDQQAEAIPVGSEGIIVLPYFMGERAPIWDVHARGTIFGLSLNHTQAHIYRAFLEAVAFSLRHSMEAVSGNASFGHLLLAGGAAKSRLWKQIIADVTGVGVVCPKQDVEANLGDVILAGVGTGTLTYEEAAKWQVFDEPIAPRAEAHRQYNRWYQEYLALYKSLAGNMKSLSQAMAEQ